MIARIIQASVKARFLVLLAAALLIAIGIGAVRTTPVDALPDLSDVQVIVRTTYPGQAPRIVEDQVTYPIATTMLSVPGARVVAASEPEMGVKLKDALIKTLTGGEKIPVRRLHQDFIEVLPQFKIILSGNHKPRIDDTSDGIWRRVNLVPWEVQIPREEVDRALPRKLRKEAQGVFAWMVEGALDYLNYGLAPPEKVLMATQEYREESDPIGAFVRGACIVTGKEEESSTPGDLFIGYSNWASREGAAEFKQATFARRFLDYTRMSWEGPDGKMHQFWRAKNSTTFYRGITVRDEFVKPPGNRAPDPSPEDYGR